MPIPALGARARRAVREYTTGEEIANSITHGIGALGGVAALVLLIVFSVHHGGGVRLASGLVFGITLILEYTASTLYHALTNDKAKRVFKVLDHSSIYLLIAGTYTPFCLITLESAGGLGLCIAIWVLAVIGIAVEAFWVFRPRWSTALIYILMGWLIVFKMGALITYCPTGGLVLLVAGGICYTLGTVFYVLKQVRYMHSIWHLWTLAGSVCHFFAVLLFVI